MIEAGYERDRLEGQQGAVRWWLYLHLAGPAARPQGPRRGVADRGFRFARGGRSTTETEAREALEDARAEALRELGYWRHQPSHRLGPGGELVPLDEVPLELASPPGRSVPPLV